MKSIYLLMIGLVLISPAIAQDESGEKKGFRKDLLFSGGGITLSFSSEGTVLGASPVLGYSITRWLDAGIVVNFIYASGHVIYRDLITGQDYSSNDKLKQTIVGPGAFVRIFPVKFLFVQAQAERNFTSQKLIYANGSPT